MRLQTLPFTQGYDFPKLHKSIHYNVITFTGRFQVSARFVEGTPIYIVQV